MHRCTNTWSHPSICTCTEHTIRCEHGHMYASVYVVTGSCVHMRMCVHVHVPFVIGILRKTSKPKFAEPSCENNVVAMAEQPNTLATLKATTAQVKDFSRKYPAWLKENPDSQFAKTYADLQTRAARNNAVAVWSAMKVRNQLFKLCRFLDCLWGPRCPSEQGPQI